MYGIDVCVARKTSEGGREDRVALKFQRTTIAGTHRRALDVLP